MADSHRHSSDVTGADIDGAQNVTVGKSNRQEVDGRYGGQSSVTINHEPQASGDALQRIYETMMAHWRTQQDGMEEIRAELGKLRETVNQTQREVREIGEGMTKAVQLDRAHPQAFYMGFALLALPVPLYFEGFLDLIDLNWPLALLLSLSCYAVSAGFWHYMWWGNR